MIIGDGLIASAFRACAWNDDGVAIFASGVSNSSETREDEFRRERDLLLDVINAGKKLIYFSTCSIYDPAAQASAYVSHKKEMEALVATCREFFIFRLPQVVGRSKNPHTLTNFIFKKIISREKFDLWRHAERNLIDVDHVVEIAASLVEAQVSLNDVVNIACPFSVKVAEIVSIFENILSERASYNIVDAGAGYHIDAGIASRVAQSIGVDFDGRYVERLLLKYYAPN